MCDACQTHDLLVAEVDLLRRVVAILAKRAGTGLATIDHDTMDRVDLSKLGFDTDEYGVTFDATRT
jgi:hypothetical protein